MVSGGADVDFDVDARIQWIPLQSWTIVMK